MMTPHPVQDARPANALSIDEGVAALVVEPFTRELTEAEKAAIRGAKRVRIFVDNRVAANLSRTVKAPIKIVDYPPDTLRWCVSIATSILVGVFDCRKPSREDDVEALLRKFDTPEIEDEFCVMRVLTDAPFDVGDYVAMHRPYVPFKVVTSPTAANETTDQIMGDIARSN
ncbi:MAG: hypothetical protein J0H42_25555 [Rhizobiales bacterium]|nr:hypothetical protein [Hyphomicrobiales bacterium]